MPREIGWKIFFFHELSSTDKEVSRAELRPLQHSYVEALTPSVTVFEIRPLKKVMKVK